MGVRELAVREGCPGPVHMWRPNTDVFGRPNTEGTNRFMSRTDMLTNRTMYPIGRIPLDIEHLLRWRLHYRLKQIPRPPSVHGCINDCLFLQAMPPHRCMCSLCEAGEGPCDEMNQKSVERDEANDGMTLRVESLLAEHNWLSWNDDASPIFKVEKHETKKGDQVGTLGPAPGTPFRWKFQRPALSAWTASTWDADPLIKEWNEEDVAEIPELEENAMCRGSYGHWSANGSFRIEREWLDYGEDEGIGRGNDDTFQEEMASAIVKNRRALVRGRGGTGKSHLIKLLRPKFKALGYQVMCIAFTHVAVANVNDVEYPAYTILYLFHHFLGNKRNKKKYAIIVDECSMVPLSMWSALLNVTFTGHSVVVLGDPDGQFAPIEDQHRMEQWEGLWDSRFMRDLCGCLRITLSKFRRQATDGRPLDLPGADPKKSI